MPGELLTTKFFFPPVRPDLVLRQRLVDKLSAGLANKLTLVCAPAGFGKTTLLSQGLHKLGVPVTWLTLDRSDNEETQFWRYLITALGKLWPDIGKAQLKLIEVPHPVDVQAIITAVLNQIAGQNTAAGRPSIIVLDDYQVIEALPINEGVTFLIDHLPINVHLVISCRSDPLLPIARLRANGQLTEFRTADLRFTCEEAAYFFNNVMSLALTPRDIQILDTRTEGWIAGIQMAALSIQGRSDIHSFIEAFGGSNRYVMDYLIEEVLQKQTVEIRSFLLQTCILDRMTAALCDAVTDSQASIKLLRELEAANLFIVPLDDNRQWYRYHHLFADLLRNQLTDSQPDLLPILHSRASVWFEQQGMYSQAITHSMNANDVDRTARLIDQTFIKHMSHGEFYSTMANRISSLPEQVIQASPQLGVWWAWMKMLTLRLDVVEPRLQQIEQLATGSLSTHIQMLISVIRADLARHMGDFTSAIELSNQVLEALGESRNSSPEQARGVVFTLAYANLRKGKIVEAKKWFSEVMKFSEAMHSITLILTAMRGLADTLMVQGKLNEAIDIHKSAIQLADKFAADSGEPVPAVAYTHIGLGEILRERNDLESATRHLDRGIELSHEWEINDEICNGSISLARLRQAQGDLTGADNAIQQAQQIIEDYRVVPGFSVPVATSLAHIMLIRSRNDTGAYNHSLLEIVEKWAQDRESTFRGPEQSLDTESENLVLARLLVAQNKADDALRLLAPMLNAAESDDRGSRIIEILCIQALAYERLAENNRAIQALCRALSLAKPEGFTRVFLDEGLPIARLLTKAVDANICPDYAARLLSILSSEARKPIRVSISINESTEQSATHVTLSPRELEVLRLVASGMSNKDMADKLYLSVGTVKRHINNIYSKLGIERRSQAVTRAQELGLV